MIKFNLILLLLPAKKLWLQDCSSYCCLGNGLCCPQPNMPFIEYYSEIVSSFDQFLDDVGMWSIVSVDWMRLQFEISLIRYLALAFMVFTITCHCVLFQLFWNLFPYFSSVIGQILSFFTKSCFRVAKFSGLWTAGFFKPSWSSLISCYNWWFFPSDTCFS